MTKEIIGSGENERSIQGTWTQSSNTNNHEFLGKNTKGEKIKLTIRTKDGLVKSIDTNFTIDSDLDLLEIVEEKCMTLPGGEKYQDEFHDMKLLTKLYERHEKLDKELSGDEIAFVYVLGRELKGFHDLSYDNRINDITRGRDLLDDFNKVDDKYKEKATLHLIEPLKREYALFYGMREYRGFTGEQPCKIWDFIKQWGGDDTAVNLYYVYNTNTLTDKQRSEIWDFIDAKGKNRTLQHLEKVLETNEISDENKDRAKQAVETIKSRITE